MFRKRPDTGRWEGRIVIGHRSDGRPIFKSVYGKTQKEALEKFLDFKEFYRRVDLNEDYYMPLSDWLDRWLIEYAQPVIRKSTFNSYRNHINNHIKPILGDKQIGKITPQHVQKMYGQLLSNGRVDQYSDKGPGLSRTTVHSVHVMFRQAMEAAVKERLIPANPTDGAVPPKRDTAPMKVLNGEQLDQFMQAIAQDPLWRDFFYTEVTTGLRKGEICALQWEDFDETAGTLKVCRTLRMVKKTILLEEPKTSAGARIIVLPPSTATILRNRWAEQASFSKWIFPNHKTPEDPLSPNAAYYHFKRLLSKANLPNIRFHDLRHTFATHALTSGVDTKVLSGILGHTNASFTMDTYAHVTTEMHYRAAGIVGDYLADVFGKELKPWERKEPEGPGPFDKEKTGNGKAGM